VLSSNNHTLKLRNTAGKHAAVLLAATSPTAVPTAANSVLLVEDAGRPLGAGVAAPSRRGRPPTTPSSPRRGRRAGARRERGEDPATGNTAVAGTLLVSGAATLASGSVTGAWSIGGTATRAGAEVLSGAIDATLTANTDNWAPTGVATARIIRIGSTGGPWNLTGIAAPTGPVRQVLTLRNVSGVNVVLIYNSGSSLAGNRFVLPNGVNVTIAPQGALTLWYDTATAAWAPLDRAS
jgi:hypothetical protein